MAFSTSTCARSHDSTHWCWQVCGHRAEVLLTIHGCSVLLVKSCFLVVAIMTQRFLWDSSTYWKLSISNRMQESKVLEFACDVVTWRHVIPVLPLTVPQVQNCIDTADHKVRGHCSKSSPSAVVMQATCIHACAYAWLLESWLAGMLGI